MEEALHNRVISQDKAISALSRAIRRSRAGSRTRTGPVGSFVFLGPTGVGKTELARAVANFLFGSDPRPHPLRHVGIHGEALGVEADRLAAGIRRATKRAGSSPRR
jgi:AAA+ superfamily predicted ATPase